jgi:hypothetical protein
LTRARVDLSLLALLALFVLLDCFIFFEPTGERVGVIGVGEVGEVGAGIGSRVGAGIGSARVARFPVWSKQKDRPFK